MRRKKPGLVILTILMASLLVSILPLAFSLYKSGPGGVFEIEFVGEETVNGGIKYTYEVESGSGIYRIRNIVFFSRAFRRYEVVASSETTFQAGWRLFFPEPYNNNEDRTIWFVLGLDYEPNPVIGSIGCRVKIKYSCFIVVDGPTLP